MNKIENHKNNHKPTRADEFFDEILKKVYSPKEKSPQLNFYSSDLGYGDRRIFLSMFGIKPTNPHNQIDNFEMDIGTEIHSLVDNIFKMAGICKCPESKDFRVADADLNLSGKIDNVIIENGKEIYVEIKTLKDFGCKTRKKYDDTIWFYGIDTKPRDDDVIQLQSYMMMRPVDYGYIIYINRNGQSLFQGTNEFYVWKIYPDIKIHQQIKEKITRISQFLDDGTLPPKCDDCQSWEKYPATKCIYRDYCLKMEKKEAKENEKM